jgi:hypothetical protein
MSPSRIRRPVASGLVVQRRSADLNHAPSEKLGGLATRPMRLQLYTVRSVSAGAAPSIKDPAGLEAGRRKSDIR